MASDLDLLIKQRDEARAAVRKIDDAIAEYESREAWEQRDIARAEHEHRYLQSLPIDNQVWGHLASCAEAAGEAWLFTADVLQRDRELAEQYSEQETRS